MVTKKTKTKEVVDRVDPVVIRGSHSIRREYADGRVEFETIWEDLVRDVNEALKEYQISQLESIDPDKRTWYYDEQGVKRSKTTDKSVEKKPAKKSVKKSAKAK